MDRSFPVAHGLKTPSPWDSAPLVSRFPRSSIKGEGSGQQKITIENPYETNFLVITDINPP
jgi:hypothetical protein